MVPGKYYQRSLILRSNTKSGVEIHFTTCPNEKCSRCKAQLIVLPELDTEKYYQAPAQTATVKSVNTAQTGSAEAGSERNGEANELQTGSREGNKKLSFADFTIILPR